MWLAGESPQHVLMKASRSGRARHVAIDCCSRLWTLTDDSASNLVRARLNACERLCWSASGSGQRLLLLHTTYLPRKKSRAVLYCHASP